jgi:heat shock protein HslJ
MVHNEAMTSPSPRLALGLPLLAMLSMLACDPKPEPETGLEDRVFLSQSVTEGGAPQLLVEDTELRLQFHEAPRLSASAGCNTLGGDYSIDGDVFVLAGAAQTEIGCEQELHAQDDWYFEFLGSSPTIVVDGDSLVLEGGGTRIEYLDQEVATPDEELVGPTWTVETIIEGDVASFTEWPEPATLVFGSDGAVTVNTGCNGGSGTYEVSGGELTFADVAVTERGCEGDTGRLESVVLGVIHGPQPVTWEVTVDRLSLRGQDAGLDLRASDG